MISDDIRNSINVWAKKRDRKNSDTLIILAITFIEDNRIDWNTPTGKAKVISYINEFYYGETGQHHTLYDDGIAQKSNTNPFELSLDEIFPPDSTDDGESTVTPTEVNKTITLVSNPKDPESDTISYTNKIDTLPFPIEIKEILKELEDKSYKSGILTNLNPHGRLKLVRKAKILAYTKKQ
jgi:hypothetical protein